MTNIRAALPKGKLLFPTATMLERAGWGLDDYNDKARVYSLTSRTIAGLHAKMFQEKDIPIQVALGNYDLGICGFDWVEEQSVKYPDSAVVKLLELGYGGGVVFAAASPGTIRSGEITTRGAGVRIASEYPNLAEALAEKMRLRRFSILALWGSAEAYPPENAEMVLLTKQSEAEVMALGLEPLGRVIEFRACLIANRESLRSKDLSMLLASLSAQQEASTPSRSVDTLGVSGFTQGSAEKKVADPSVVRVALPDGHQQSHVRAILDAAGVQIEDYPSTKNNRRPASGLEGISITVIRPQDMPLQVANGNFDLAITGRDWLTDHLYQFPDSPVKELLNLKYGRVRIVAVVHKDVLVNTTGELETTRQSQDGYCRIAAEYVNIADNYARINHLGAYRVVPTWGATEAFLPDDADVLIENTETGSTLAKNNLKIIETLFESTACLIGSTRNPGTPLKAERKEAFVALLRNAMGKMN